MMKVTILCTYPEHPVNPYLSTWLAQISNVHHVSLGACVIEKHFTLDRNGGGPDDSFSLELKELKALCQESKTAWRSLGQVDYGLKSSESGNVQFRRSLYYGEDVKAGCSLKKEHLRSVRPGDGVAPKYYDDIIGKKLVRDKNRFTPVNREDFE